MSQDENGPTAHVTAWNKGNESTPAVLQEIPEPKLLVTKPAELLVDGVPAHVAIATPPAWDYHEVDTSELERELLAAPRRQTGTLEVENTTSFVDAVLDRRLSDNVPAVYARHDDMAIVAVLNGPHGDERGHGDYRVRAQIERSPEWQAWLAGSGKFFPQAQFADFIEDHLPEIQEPDQATMMELAQTFTATSTSTFKRAQSTQSGVMSVVAENTENAAAGRDGRLEIPERIKFAVRLFKGGDRVLVSARFRYRISNEGGLSLGWRLDQPEENERELFDELVEAVGEALDVTVIRGRATA